jgi:hypothetical protein
MSLAKRFFPNAGDAQRRRAFRNLQTALILGLVCGALVGLGLWLLYLSQKP